MERTPTKQQQFHVTPPARASGTQDSRESQGLPCPGSLQLGSLRPRAREPSDRRVSESFPTPRGRIEAGLAEDWRRGSIRSIRISPR